jgi:hypothetical protein
LAVALATTGFPAERYSKLAIIPPLEKPLRSPDGGLELVYKENQKASDYRIHEIWVRSTKHPGESSLLYAMGRSGAVLWSPNSKMVAVENAASSTDSFVHVFRVWSPNKVSEINQVADFLKARFFDNENIRGDHRYAELDKWSSDSKSLIVRLRAHGLEVRDGQPREAEEYQRTITIAIPQK